VDLELEAACMEVVSIAQELHPGSLIPEDQPSVGIVGDAAR
jgi:hypothetical protein